MIASKFTHELDNHDRSIVRTLETMLRGRTDAEADIIHEAIRRVKWSMYTGGVHGELPSGDAHVNV